MPLKRAWLKTGLFMAQMPMDNEKAASIATSHYPQVNADEKVIIPEVYYREPTLSINSC
ncbi:MAG: hypothetical protein KAJ63_09495 [Methyloprofundus sp.]|nr:hypothetical protein [Methyloprofundus sp.]